jgi:uncharacterized membrane protein
MLRRKKTIIALVALTYLYATAFTLDPRQIFTTNTEYTVTVDAPMDQVWQYVGDSTKARDWSVYFHHISPLPGIADGKIGAVRRCYRREDETGMTWDEKVVDVKKHQYRKIHTYNVQGLSIDYFHQTEYNVTQKFKAINDQQTNVTFAFTVRKPNNFLAWMGNRVLRWSAWRVFKVNLENIKHHIEQGENYQRIHPYEQSNLLD